MNLYMRLLLIVIKTLFNKNRINLDESSRIDFRILPHDCDINVHLTNSRYFGFMDLARLWMLAEMQVLDQVLGNGWLPVVSDQEISYYRPIKPFSRITLESRIAGWDEKYFYVEQGFLCNGKLHARANVKGLFMHKQRQIDPSQVLALLEESQPKEKKNPAIGLWNGYLAHKREG